MQFPHLRPGTSAGVRRAFFPAVSAVSAAAAMLLFPSCAAPSGSGTSRGASRGVAAIDLTAKAWFPPIVRQQGN
ncbi:MAG: hypothetical protein JWL81_3297, partial [Verrucomicrobiales bacterium]|nr:hypothetical protein [Verrucomicrobiales bacterium]